MSTPENQDQRAMRHAGEIQAIIDEHTALAEHKDGRELIEVRQKCSRAIAEACRRHVAENNVLDQAEAEPAPAKSEADPTK